MQLKLAIIHLDMVIDTLTLEEGEYSLGRSSKNNIVVQHFSLEPDQGKVFFEEGQWFYEDFEKGRTRVINNAEVIAVSDQISLATQDYIESGRSPLTALSAKKNQHRAKLQKRKIWAASFVAVLILSTFGGYQLFRLNNRPVSENQLLNKVRDKIVEFEINRDDKSIEQLKKYAGLSDSDFKESSGFCTGFLVGPNVVLTAAHCLFGQMVIDINNDFYLKTSDGAKHKILKVLGFDVKRDFLYLQMEGMEKYGHLQFADQYQIEQKVYTVGNVHGEGIAIRDGILSSESTDADYPDVKFLRYSAGTSPGNSGGPLVDSEGRVVALVFAATSTENFNLGTPSSDLKAAYEQFVLKGTESQTITLQMKRVLNFKPAVMLQALSLPYLPQFEEYPEISQKFNEISIDVAVPMEFADVDKVILEPLNKTVIETFYEVQAILRKNKEVVLDWGSFVSAKTPAILPSQFDISQSQFVKRNGRYYPLLAGLIDSPSKTDYKKYLERLDKEGVFDFQSYGYNIEVSDEKVDLLDSDVFYKPKDDSGNKPRIFNLSYGPPYSQLLVHGTDDPRTVGFFGLKLFLKNYLGQNGVIANSLSRFVRPQAIKDFTLKDIEVANDDIETTEVKDRLGRTWKRSRLKLFESMNLMTYCLDLPEGPFCVGRMFNLYNNFLLTVIENNFRKFILSHLLINPYFWKPQRLVTYLQEGQGRELESMQGVQLKVAGSSLKGFLSDFGTEFELPMASIESVRLQTGLLARESGEADWAGFGLDWIQKQKDGDKVCGLGAEIIDSQSSFILNYLRERKAQEKMKKIKGENAQPLPGIWYRAFRGHPVPFQLYGYCAPIVEDPRIANNYFVDFKNATPFKFNHNVRPASAVTKPSNETPTEDANKKAEGA